ncbi:MULTISPECIES: hypothetical protein [unclassified Streptomyces]|uniref:hypothetical protein n=1 Tax=unclassified Streptomyces TaxID=2593676 RepID=UPI002E2BE6FF|nr:hypothetical protein [Streptomyces sp. NBC_00223]
MHAQTVTTPPPGPLSWGPRNVPVPYAAAWSGEKATVGGALTVRPDGSGLAYRDETPADRDRNGVLWARMTDSPGAGRPNYRMMHAHRQRHAMLHLLCQVCGGPADRTSRGVLFLLPRPDPAEQAQPDWPEGGLCSKPPVCRPCAALALRHCPHLTDPLFVRSRKPRVWGAFGGFYVPGPGGSLTPTPDDHLPYGHPGTPWFLASQLLLQLTRCTPAPEDFTP